MMRQVASIQYNKASISIPPYKSTTLRLLLLLSCLQTYISSLSLSSSTHYTLLDSEQLYIRMHSLANTYPNFVKLKTSQELYDLPSVGDYDDCPFDNDTGCNMWIFTIEDKIAHPIGSESHKALPEIFISGAIHGSERVGPTASMETASLLLEAAHCEALPIGSSPTSEDTKDVWDQWAGQIAQARYCRRHLKSKGIPEEYRKWLARLVTTRRIVMAPTVNALGFFRGIDREISDVSVKSDFPFDIKIEGKEFHMCMKTIAARTINELYRTHLFQISLSFHSGEVFTGYPYGSLSNLHEVPPDINSMDQISEALSVYGGGMSWSELDRYPTGQINDMIGPRGGRFEDWAYAGSWFNHTKIHRHTCNPSTYGGYSEQKTIYDNTMLRSIPFLIETSITDKPRKDHLGTNHDLFDPESSGTGHIPRNIRAILMGIDVVEPYVTIQSVNHLQIQDDIVPLSARVNRDCAHTKLMSIPEGTDTVDLHYEVGGAINVDDTSIWYAKWDDLPEGFNGNIQPSAIDISTFYSIKNNDKKKVHVTPGSKGKTKWYNAKQSEKKHVKGPVFKTTINMSDFRKGDVIAVFAVVEADESWSTSIPSKSQEKILPPQSHLVNARTNPSWYHVNKYTQKYIQGRRQFFSIPVSIQISSKASILEEKSVRFDYYTRKQEIIQEIERDSLDIFVILGLFCFMGYVGYAYRLQLFWSLWYMIRPFSVFKKKPELYTIRPFSVFKKKPGFKESFPMDVPEDEQEKLIPTL